MKILASDFDNTLHFHDKHGGFYHQDDLNAIKRFTDEGNIFGLCTGRAMFGFDGDLDKGPHLDFIIASAGAHICQGDDHEIIRSDNISLVDAKRIFSELNSQTNLYFHADGKIYCMQPGAPQYEHRINIKYLDELAGKVITGISVWTPSDKEASILTSELNKEYVGKVAFYQNGNWLDVIASGVSKGTGAIFVKEYFKAESLACIGDSYNDIPMLDKADISFTFKSSPKEVQDHATYIVDTLAQAVDVFLKK